jgi:serum/glucocorticoid-regulated kinase 2
LFSAVVEKINRKEKVQKRVLMITDQGVYNLLPSLALCKRRIGLERVAAMTVSSVSDEFVLHVPSEYDYRFSSALKQRIVEVLRSARFALIGAELEVEAVSETFLRELTRTRPQAAREGRSGVQDTSEASGGTEALSSSSLSLSSGAAASSSKAGHLAVGARAGLTPIREEDEPGSDEDTMAASKEEMDDEIESARSRSETVGWSRRETKVTLADFDLLKVIGRGSFGKVMLVRKKGSSEVLAMKILAKAAIVKRNQVEHTQAERAILESIDFPFLVRLKYAFQTATKLYMVMPFLRGGELFFHLRKVKRFTPEQAKFFAAEIALGIGHLHSKGVIYRDLKPENILLDDDGHVCLTDFGLAKSLTQPGEKTETFCGTPEYLAPEVITTGSHDKEVDWWALGILTYEMLHGLPPFYSSNVQVMYDKIESAPVAFPAHFSPEAVDFITQILNKDPTKRLGAGADDIEAIKAHPFFAEIDFDKLVRREIDSPFKPKVRGTSDTSNFDREFTSEPVVDSVAPDSGFSMGSQGKFEGFTFVDRGAMS